MFVRTLGRHFPRLRRTLLGCALLELALRTVGAGEDSAAGDSAPGDLNVPVAAGDPQATEGNPYSIIPTRNAFGIRPPAPPPAPPAPPPAPKPPSNLFLTGISDWQGVKTVYLQVNQQGSAGPEFLELAEGDSQDDIKVLEIDPKAEKVRLVHQGQELSLNFKENGLKAATPAPAKGAVRTVAGRTVTPGVSTGAVPAPSRVTGPTVIGRGGSVQAQPPAAPFTAPIQTGVAPRVGNTVVPGIAPGAVRSTPALPNLQNRVRNIPPPPPLPVDPGLLQINPGN